VALGYESGLNVLGSDSLLVGNNAGAGSSGNECLFVGTGCGKSNNVDLQLAIGMSRPLLRRLPLITGNLDTSNSPEVTVMGAMKLNQNPLQTSAPGNDGFVLQQATGDGTVWQMCVLDNGSLMIRKNGEPFFVLDTFD
jgi:hypothetical protein